MDDLERSERKKQEVWEIYPTIMFQWGSYDRQRQTSTEERTVENRNINHFYRWPIICIEQQLLALQLFYSKMVFDIFLQKYTEKCVNNHKLCNQREEDSINVKRLNLTKDSWIVNNSHYLRNRIMDSIA